jgi:hypothetical protein
MTAVFDRRRRPGLVLLALLLPLGGCSVGMALSGDEPPDLSYCTVGEGRSDIELEVGPPMTVEDLPDGSQVCTYEYVVGNEVSPERAIVYGTADALTFGLWELVGTPIEARRGQAYRLTVTYDADGRAREVSVTEAD